MEVTRLTGNTDRFGPVVGPATKHFSAWRARKRIDLMELRASSADIVGGYNVELQNFPFFTYGTIAGELNYDRPIELHQAFRDLKRLGRQTGRDFTVDMNARVDLNFLVGPWYVAKCRKTPNVAPVRAEISFPALLTDATRERLAPLAEKIYEPKMEGDGMYWTRRDEHTGTGSHTPTVELLRSWEHFNEKEVVGLFNRLREFEQTHLKTHPSHGLSMTLRVLSPTPDASEVFCMSYLDFQGTRR